MMFMSPEMMAQMPTYQAGMQPYLSSMAGSGAAPPTAFQQEQAVAAQGAPPQMSMGQAPTAAAPMIPANQQLPAYSTAQPGQAPAGEADWRHPHAEAVEQIGPHYFEHLRQVAARHGGEAAAFNHALHVFHMMRAGHTRAADHLDQRVAEAIAHHGSVAEAVHFGNHVAEAMRHIVAAHRGMHR
jgi:hypothetical protein